MKKLLLLALLSSSVYAQTNDCTISLPPKSGFKNQAIMVTSFNTVSLYNATSHDVGYDYTFKLCPFDETCKMITKHVLLHSGQSFSDQIPLEVRSLYHVQGNFPAYATCGVAGGLRLSKSIYGNVTVY